MQIAGILNITEDSFSDGNEFIEEKKAILQAEKLIQDGATVIDIGAQSSNINSKQVSAEEEWMRIEPVLSYLKTKKIPISIDTYKPSVIRNSILSGVNYINSITALNDEESMKILSEYKSNLPDLILMYSYDNGIRAGKNSSLKVESIVDDISFFFEGRIKSLLRIGVPIEKLYFDPGMGMFLGSDPMLSIKVLAEISILKKRFQKIYVSVSRKSFLGNLLGGVDPLERKNATLAVEIYLYREGIDFIRTHEPGPIKEAITIYNNIFKFYGENKK